MIQPLHPVIVLENTQIKTFILYYKFIHIIISVDWVYMGSIFLTILNMHFLTGGYKQTSSEELNGYEL